MNSIKCPVCDGSEIDKDICVSDISGVYSDNYAGLCWATKSFFEFTNNQIEPLMADLCTTCGTIVRFHVRNPNRTWTKISAKSKG